MLAPAGYIFKLTIPRGAEKRFSKQRLQTFKYPLQHNLFYIFLLFFYCKMFAFIISKITLTISASLQPNAFSNSRGSSRSAGKYHNKGSFHLCLLFILKKYRGFINYADSEANVEDGVLFWISP